MIFLVFYFILCFFTILGIIDLIKIFINWSYFSSLDLYQKEKIFLLPLKGHYENIEYVIRSIIGIHKFYFFKCRIKIICLDFGIDAETKKICCLLSKDFNCIKIINSKSKIHHSDI